jgi:hypothetical protein
MKNAIVNSWELVMDNQHNPLRHLDAASQHIVMQALAWMWSMAFSLTFLSIFHFGAVWGGHLIIIAAICFTVATFKQAEKQALPKEGDTRAPSLSNASQCPWQLDREA